MNNKYVVPVLFSLIAVALFAVIILFVIFPKNKIVSDVEDHTPTSTTSTTVDNSPEIISGVKSILYTNTKNNYQFWYPATAAISYNQVAADTVRVSLTSTMFTGTNLNEAYVEVGVDVGPAEVGVNAKQSILDKCIQPRDWEKYEGVITISGKDFSLFEGTDAGAGNLYESRSYRRVENSHCYEVTEVLHSGNIYNYEPGAVKAFDKPYFSGILDKIAKTFEFINNGK